MADGLNDARAMRITEVMTDFRTEAHRVTSLNMPAGPDEQREIGFLIFNQSSAQCRQLLAQPFDGGRVSGGDPESTKMELKRILLDAASRRFQMHRAYLRIMCAARWVGRRRQIGQKNAANARAHMTNDQTLRTEYAAVTDTKVFDELKNKDTAAGHWQGDMPEFSTLLAYIRTH